MASSRERHPTCHSFDVPRSSLGVSGGVERCGEMWRIGSICRRQRFQCVALACSDQRMSRDAFSLVNALADHTCTTYAFRTVPQPLALFKLVVIPKQPHFGAVCPTGRNCKPTHARAVGFADRMSYSRLPRLLFSMLGLVRAGYQPTSIFFACLEVNGPLWATNDSAFCFLLFAAPR